MSSDDYGTSPPSTLQQGRESIVAVYARALERGFMARVLKSEFVEYEIFEADSAAALSRSIFGQPRLVILRIDSEQPSDAIARGLAAIRRSCPKSFIALVCDDDERCLQDAFLHGCNGYLPTSMPLEIAVAALRLVLMGGLYFPPPIRPAERGETTGPARKAGLIRRGPPRPAAPLERAPAAVLFCEPSGAGDRGAHPAAPRFVAPPTETVAPSLPGFTPREREVIDALQRGRSNKVIASDLKLSENTVKVHVRHVMRKLRATNRTQAALRSQLLFSAEQPVN